MNILVANPSYQSMRFEYRLPEVFDRDPKSGELFPKLFQTTIAAGTQVKLVPGDFSETQKNAVIEQLERFGAVPESEVRRMAIVIPGTSPIRKPLVFSIQAAIKSDRMDEAREADESIRQQVSDREAEAAGCATIPPNIPPEVAHALRQTQQESSMHIEQIQTLDGKDPRTQKGGINKTITVSKKAGARERKVG